MKPRFQTLKLQVKDEADDGIRALNDKLNGKTILKSQRLVGAHLYYTNGTRATWYVLVENQGELILS